LRHHGLGYCEVGARSGCDVIVVDVSTAALESAKAKMTASLDKALNAGKLAEPVDAVMARVRFTTDMGTFADREIVIEAIRETVTDKVTLVSQLDEVLAPQAIIATNTSSIPVAQIAAASRLPGRVVGTHFFNPVPVMPLVEVIACLVTDPETADAADDFCANVLGKKVIRAADRGGFVVNAILVPYLLSAIRSLQNGVAKSRGHRDEGMVGGCGMRWVRCACAT